MLLGKKYEDIYSSTKSLEIRDKVLNRKGHSYEKLISEGKKAYLSEIKWNEAINYNRGKDRMVKTGAQSTRGSYFGGSKNQKQLLMFTFPRAHFHKKEQRKKLFKKAKITLKSVVKHFASKVREEEKRTRKKKFSYIRKVGKMVKNWKRKATGGKNTVVRYKRMYSKKPSFAEGGYSEEPKLFLNSLSPQRRMRKALSKIPQVFLRKSTTPCRTMIQNNLDQIPRMESPDNNSKLRSLNDSPLLDSASLRPNRVNRGRTLRISVVPSIPNFKEFSSQNSLRFKIKTLDPQAIEGISPSLESPQKLTKSIKTRIPSIQEATLTEQQTSTNFFTKKKSKRSSATKHKNIKKEKPKWSNSLDLRKVKNSGSDRRSVSRSKFNKRQKNPPSKYKRVSRTHSPSKDLNKTCFQFPRKTESKFRSAQKMKTRSHWSLKKKRGKTFSVGFRGTGRELPRVDGKKKALFVKKKKGKKGDRYLYEYSPMSLYLDKRFKPIMEHQGSRMIKSFYHC